MRHETNVGPGWRPITIAAIAAIERLGGHIAQVKEKFGGLRIYVHGGDVDNIAAIVENAELLCSQICEECGKPATRQVINGWIKTICPSCKKELDRP